MRADIGIYFALVGIVLPVASTVKAFRSPSWRQMKRWATDAGVTITENNEDMIRQRLGRARRYRSVASLPFWWLFFLPILDDRSQFGWAGMWAWIPLTVALGSMLAGASDLGPADGTRTALLAPGCRLGMCGHPPGSPPGRCSDFPGCSSPLPRCSRRAFRCRSGLRSLSLWSPSSPLGLPSWSFVSSPPGHSRQRRRAGSMPTTLRSTGATAAIASAILVSAMTMATGVSALLVPGHRMWIGAPLWIVSGLATFAALIAIMYQAPWLPRRPRTVPTEATHEQVDA